MNSPIRFPEDPLFNYQNGLLSPFRSQRIGVLLITRIHQLTTGLLDLVGRG